MKMAITITSQSQPLLNTVNLPQYFIIQSLPTVPPLPNNMERVLYPVKFIEYKLSATVFLAHLLAPALLVNAVRVACF